MARFLLICALLLTGMSVYAQTALSGKVTDAKTGEALFAANVVLLKGGKIAAGAETDFDGNFSITGLDAGNYDIRCSYTGMSENLIQGFQIKNDKANKLDIAMESNAAELGVVIIKEYKNKPIDLDNTTVSKALTGKEVAAMPTKNLESVVSAAAGVGQADEGRGITVRGSRDDGNLYMVDGVRVGAGSLPPAQDVEQLEIITGGLPAAMGDASGGIISVTTKSGASKFTGGAELETSQYLDAFGYNLIGANLAGPIVKNKDKEAIVSFRLSGQYRTRMDDNPYAIGFTKVKDDVLADLKENPAELTGIANINGVRSPIVAARARTLNASQLENVKANPNARDTRYDVNGKVDFKLSKQMDFVLGGNYWKENSKITDVARNLMNYDRYGNSGTDNLRVWGRVRHRLDAEKKDKKEVSMLENVLYTLQAGYTTRNDKISDPIHGDNLFNYGYVGIFENRYDIATQTALDGTVYQTPYKPSLYSYKENPNFMDNSTLINANKPYKDFITNGEPNQLSMESMSAYNGFISNDFRFNYFDGGSGGDLDQGISAVGVSYNRVQKRQRDIAEVRIDGNFDFLPTRNRNNVHSIQMGLLYEQRDEKLWSMNPRSLYRLGSQLVNKQLLNGFDSSMVVETRLGVDLFAPSYVEDSHTNFDKQLRESLGMPVQGREFLDVNRLSPDQLKLSMFSADELSNLRGGGSSALNYYGYDYLGNALTGNVKFDDFFTKKDERGNYTRPLAAFTPNYAVGYIQDKFKLQDIIFRIGMRVDRYDASTKTLIDPFNFYDGHTYRAEEYAQEKKFTRPANIGEDFIVYADPNSPYNPDAPDASVQAYRKGEQWYNKQGTAVNDPSIIFGNTGKATPALRSTFTSESGITGKDFEVNKTFSTYSPQIIVSPRLSFSFPISKTAGFFAHYDVLVQRPPSNNIATALDYYYFQAITDLGGVFPNSNLKPQRTIDYEVGFQQMVSKTAAIKLQAYYKEMRDMIQERVFAKAYPNSYTSYSNIDFGTVKGLTFTFDQRTLNNLQFNMAYTLQFADGTGSSSTSSRNLPEGTINRSIFPLSFDERHKIVLSADYHYPSGKDYEGPVVFGYKIFADAGINLLTSFTSGRPYTQEEIPVRWGGNVKVGSIAGSRLPWNNVVNLRIDKNFTLSKNPKSPLALNVYFRVQNLLDTRNILSVYSVTGSPYSDGYLATNKGNGEAVASGDAATYTLYYNTVMLNPDRFSLPRRMFVGAQFFF